MNQVNPISGVARLYEVLAHIKVFPCPMRPVAIASGVPEEEIPAALVPSLYAVVDDQIQPRTEMQRLEHLTLEHAQFLYDSNQVALYCKDGRPAWMFVDGYEDKSNLYMDMLAWRIGAALDKAAH